MPEQKFKVYGYRWVVLAVFMFVNLAIQVLWITYAPITGPAALYYGVSDLKIGLLALENPDLTADEIKDIIEAQVDYQTGRVTVINPEDI